MLTCTLLNCSTNDLPEKIADASVIGRWNLEGFDGRILYEFTENKRYTFYATDGNFQTLQELLDDGVSGNDWWLENSEITIDLNFGNLSTRTASYMCNNNVIEWLDDNNQVVEVYYREDYNLNDCKE